MNHHKKIFLFDMDGTLTPARREIESSTINSLKSLAARCRVGIVTGSDFDYVMQQMSRAFEVGGVPVDRIDILPCNGTKKYTASKSGSYVLDNEVNMVDEIGRDNYNHILRWCAAWQSSIMSSYRDIPYTGTFLQYRGSLLNWCPVGREAKNEEREAWVKFDQKFKVREHYANALKNKMAEPNLNIPATVALGGSTSLDIYPQGWDKTYALNHYPEWDVYFAGDRCDEGGNDWHIYEKLKAGNRAYSVDNPQETERVIEDFLSTLND